MTTTTTQSKASSNVLPIIVMFFLFAMISFVTGFQNPFGVILKEQLTLTSLQSQLGNFANFLAYAFLGIPAGMILQKKGYKFSALLACIVGIVGVGFMFLSSTFETKNTILTIYLIGAFVAGIAMCMLNTVVNPMLNTLGGGGKRGNMLLQFGGATNSLAATICPWFVGLLMGTNLRGLSLTAARPALFVAIGIFAIAIIVLALSRLPEPILDEIKREGKKEQPKIWGLLKFRHFVLGVISIFLYVGIEVGIPNMANLYMTTPDQASAKAIVDEYNKQLADPAYLAELTAQDEANKNEEGYEAKVVTADDMAKAENIANGSAPAGLGIAATIAGSIIAVYWFLMFIGRLGGGAVGAFITSRKMLIGVASVAIILLLCAVLMPVTPVNMPFVSEPVPLNVVFLVFCGLCTSVMWGSIFNLAVEGLGKYTAVASGVFMMMVCGGGILPLIQGAVADALGYMASYWVLIVALSFLLFYGLVGSKVSKKVK